jgi:hypothetical protein
MLSLLALLAGIWGAVASPGSTEPRVIGGLLAFAGTASVLYVYMKTRERSFHRELRARKRKGPT